MPASNPPWLGHAMNCTTAVCPQVPKPNLAERGALAQGAQVSGRGLAVVARRPLDAHAARPVCGLHLRVQRCVPRQSCKRLRSNIAAVAVILPSHSAIP